MTGDFESLAASPVEPDVETLIVDGCVAACGEWSNEQLVEIAENPRHKGTWLALMVAEYLNVWREIGRATVSANHGAGITRGCDGDGYTEYLDDDMNLVITVCEGCRHCDSSIAAEEDEMWGDDDV